MAEFSTCDEVTEVCVRFIQFVYRNFRSDELKFIFWNDFCSIHPKLYKSCAL